MVFKAASITISPTIYTTTEPQDQQITHVINSKSPKTGNCLSPTRQMHWRPLQPLRLWWFPSRPAAWAGAFSCIPAPRPPSHMVQISSLNSAINQSQPRSSSSYLARPFCRLFVYFPPISKYLPSVLLPCWPLLLLYFSGNEGSVF